VTAFSDGLEALACITETPDVRTLITSTQPIGITGIELCAAARELSGSRRALHVVLMSSTDDYYMAVTALDNGADDFIHKPPNPDELRARLRLADRVTSMKHQLILHATTDSLTGLLNRRAFLDDSKRLTGALEPGQAISAIMFDIDHFKRINDTYGHDAGDRVIQAVARETKALCSLTGRLGGEEFCALESCELAEAAQLASDLQRHITALRFRESGRDFTATCSFGIAEWEKGDRIERVLRRADMAMYEAKRTGRNRIVASDTFTPTKDHDTAGEGWLQAPE
jgi:diguanylate cyclase (GGDEF)-like protein